MKKFLFPILMLLSVPSFADRLGALKSNSEVQLSTQSSGFSVYPATSTIHANQGIWTSTMTVANSAYTWGGADAAWQPVAFLEADGTVNTDIELQWNRFTNALAVNMYGNGKLHYFEVLGDAKVSSLMLPVTNVTSNSSMNGLSGFFVAANAASGNINVTLPNARNGATLTYPGVLSVIKKTDASTNTVTILPYSGNIDGQASIVLTKQYDSAFLILDSDVGYQLIGTYPSVGDNLGNHIATMTITAGYGISVTTISISNMLSLAGLTSDPASLTDGSVWYRSDTLEMRCRINSHTYILNVSEP